MANIKALGGKIDYNSYNCPDLGGGCLPEQERHETAAIKDSVRERLRPPGQTK